MFLLVAHKVLDLGSLTTVRVKRRSKQKPTRCHLAAQGLDHPQLECESPSTNGRRKSKRSKCAWRA